MSAKEIEELKKELQEKDKKITSLEKQVKDKDQELAKQEDEIQELKLQILDQKQKLADRDEQIKDFQYKLKMKEIEDNKPPTCVPITVGDKKYVWKKGPKLPKPVSAGSAAVLGNKGYVYCSSGEVYEYNSREEVWTVLPPCPHKNSTIVNIPDIDDSAITAIGGMNDSNGETNQLASFVNGKWIVGYYPSMGTRRCRVTAMCDDNCILVAGGCFGEEKLSVVELFDMHNLLWYISNSLPYPLGGGTILTLGEECSYIVGGSARDVFHRYSLLRSDLDELYKCSVRITTQNVTMKLAYKPPPEEQVWKKAMDLPVQYATAILINKRLIIIGGQGTNGKHSNSIRLYNTLTEKIETIGYMGVGRSWCQVMHFPGKKIVVVGGDTDSGTTDEVEIAEVETQRAS